MTSDIEGGLDVDMEYLVSIYLCDRYVLKVQIDPDPRNRVPYYCAAYEPIPGSHRRHRPARADG